MFIRSFRFAIAGIIQAFHSGKNIRVMFACLCIVVAAGLLLCITPLEWAIILLCSGGVLALEMLNTAIENAVDLTTTDFHPLAKRAKDMAAGAVLIWSLFSAAVGLLVFLPRLFALIVP